MQGGVETIKPIHNRFIDSFDHDADRTEWWQIPNGVTNKNNYIGG